MSQLGWEVDLTEWFVEGTFIAALVFALIYIPFFKWRETVTGRATTTLVLAVAGALFRSVLILWHVIGFTIKGGSYGADTTGFWNEFFTWLSIASIGLAGVAIALLAFVALRYLVAETTNPVLCRLLRLGGAPGKKPRPNVDTPPRGFQKIQ